MLGFYNYTVWLTYGSLVSAVIGIFVSLAGHGHPYIGAIFLLISGLCDAFDGMIARTKTDRTEQEKQYGIQIDSLSDLVAFGVLPACIGAGLYKASMIFDPPQDPCLVARVPYPVYVGIFVIYVLAALIRLAYFNVQAEAGRKGAKGILWPACYQFSADFSHLFAAAAPDLRGHRHRLLRGDAADGAGLCVQIPHAQAHAAHGSDHGGHRRAGVSADPVGKIQWLPRILMGARCAFYTARCQAACCCAR